MMLALAPEMFAPTPPFPEIRLRWSRPVPPICTPLTAAPTATPPTELPWSTVPVTSVPIKLPSIRCPPPPFKEMPALPKFCKTRPRTIEVPPVSCNPLALPAPLPSMMMRRSASVPVAAKLCRLKDWE